jgi:hypothetical protein
VVSGWIERLGARSTALWSARYTPTPRVFGPIIAGFTPFHLPLNSTHIASGENWDRPNRKELVMTMFWNMRTAMSALLALSFMAGAVGKVIAYENDNDRSTRDAKAFFEKLDEERGGGN